MKKTLILTLIICFASYGIAQTTTKNNSSGLLKELSDNGCKCIDSINTYNKTKEEISKAINTCIESQAEAYQLGTKMMNIDLFSGSNSFTIGLNTDKESSEYKKYYYEVERYLMENCGSIKAKVAASDLENFFSVSKNPDAIKMYKKGQKAYEKQNFTKAIGFYQKALKIDSLYAFAWDNIGLCYRKLEKYPEAINAYNKSLELDPLGLMPLLNIAVAYKYNKEYEKSISAYERLAELDNKNPEVFYGLGLIYAFNLNNSEKGLENLCVAYNLYIAQKSPYRTDAEKIINLIYQDMKKNGKIDTFKEVLHKNNININFN